MTFSNVFIQCSKIGGQLILVLLLVLCAYLQLNDPDPVIWVTFYSLCASVPFIHLLGVSRRARAITKIGCLYCGLAMLLTLSGLFEFFQNSEGGIMQPMSHDKPYIEEAREFFGALLTLIILMISYKLSLL